MLFTSICLIASFALFLGMLGCAVFGRHMGRKRLALEGANSITGAGVVESAIFAVWGLLLAFTFSGAGSRFDLRRGLVAQEVNAIGTAYLRLDLVNKEESREELKGLFRDYVDQRLQTFNQGADFDAYAQALSEASRMQSNIWKKAELATRDGAQSAPAMLLMGSLNEMIDIVTTRDAAMRMHPPTVIFGLIFLVSLVCALFAGYSLTSVNRFNYIHLLGFILVNVVIVYVILDMEFPRLGLIRVDDIDQLMVRLRQSMNT